MERKEQVKKVFEYMNTISVIVDQNKKVNCAADLKTLFWRSIEGDLKVKKGKCMICYDENDKLLPICNHNHTLCHVCYSNWKERSAECPYCRSKMQVFLDEVGLYHFAIVVFTTFLAILVLNQLQNYRALQVASDWFIFLGLVCHFCLNWSIFTKNVRIALNISLFLLLCMGALYNSIEFGCIFCVLLILRLICTGKYDLTLTYINDFCN